MKPDGDGGCTPMQCSVEGCSKCVDDTEDECAECGGNFVSKNGGCEATKGGGGLPLGAIIGIAIGAVTLLILLLLLLLFFCCRKRKTTYEQVDHLTGNKTETQRRKSTGKVDVSEETEVTVMDAFHPGDTRRSVNPLNSPPQNDIPQTVVARRRSRRTRSIRNTGSDIADVDLEFMFDDENEIVEV
ncbi:hypothetical protein AGDE_15736 [Angomonas deanei]|nr:hypothetical protein AGDE_15736 [Angomonas deanei]|eukprot:EPY18560.1 hypothetical protein AGDE_15736 [Angomonas deanei]